MSDLHAQVVAAFMGAGQRVENLPDGDPKKAKGQAMGDAFTEGVAYLKTDFPNDRIRKLMGLVWDIVGNKIVSTAFGPDVPTVSLAAFGNPMLPQAAVFLPHNWLVDIQTNPVLQMGALVFVSSQIVDFYNRRLVGETEQSIKRARAYEAEFLLTTKKMGTPKFNEYQKKVLDQYPLGLSSPGVSDIRYTSKAFVPPA